MGAVIFGCAVIALKLIGEGLTDYLILWEERWRAKGEQQRR